MGPRAQLGDAMTHRASPAAGLPAATFCVSAAHAEEFAASEFREGGWPKPVLNGWPQTLVGELRHAGIARQAVTRGYECGKVRHAMRTRVGA